MPVWGRKALLTVGSILLGCGWGAFCVLKNVSLVDGAIFWGSVNIPLGSYHLANSYQKVKIAKVNGGGGSEC